MVVVIVLNPFWSAFTEAYAKRDYNWMRSVRKKLELLGVLSIPLLGIMILTSSFFYEIWLGSLIEIPFGLTVSVAVYILFQIFGNIYMYMINGTGKVRIQLIVYIVFAIISYPIMTFMCEKWGVMGILVLPTLVYIIQGVVGCMQLNRLINNRAIGIWNK